MFPQRINGFRGLKKLTRFVKGGKPTGVSPKPGFSVKLRFPVGGFLNQRVLKKKSFTGAGFCKVPLLKKPFQRLLKKRGPLGKAPPMWKGWGKIFGKGVPGARCVKPKLSSGYPTPRG